MIGAKVSEGGPDSVCAIAVGVMEKTETHIRFRTISSCSGTLVSETEISAAAHCARAFLQPDLPPRAIARVACGMYRTAPGEKPSFLAQSFVKEIFVTPEYLADPSGGFDGAKFVLEDAIPKELIAPMTVARDRDEVHTLLVSAHRCHIAGYGFSEGGPGLKNGPIPNRNFESDSSQGLFLMRTEVSQAAGESFLKRLAKAEGTAEADSITTFINDKELIEKEGPTLDSFVDVMKKNFPELTLMQPGDSGGPLYCYREADSQPVLVGINKSIRTTVQFTDETRTEIRAISRKQYWSYPDLPLVPMKAYVFRPENKVAE
jgi:hypothetical protein